ncbi:MAG: hypothetical protein E6J20_08475 [Chloroflexi bacterium]|nr:MAG: hypothetical protein E6J20_08475 [Chloroflexota bacterium]
MVVGRSMRTAPAARPKAPARSAEQWAVFVWRLPMGSSTPRVTVWRVLRRLGAAALTPGAALLPWREELVEQLDWLAQDVDDKGGDAWVMRVSELPEADERRVVDEINAERDGEYAAIRDHALGLLARIAKRPGPSQMDRELAALQRRFRKVRDRDYFEARGRNRAAAAIDRCLRSR